MRAGRGRNVVARGAAIVGAVLGLLAAAPLPVVDWEKAPATVLPRDDSAFSPYLNPFFTSRKTLAETTSWLRLTMERYGDVPARQRGADARWTGDVRFAGCTMQWAERTVSNGGATLEERAYTLKLGDIDGKYGTIQVAENLKASIRDGAQVRWLRRMYTIEGGRRTPDGEPFAQSDYSFYIFLQPAHDLHRRVAQALVHASRLCGGPPPH